MQLNAENSDIWADQVFMFVRTVFVVESGSYSFVDAQTNVIITGGSNTVGTRRNLYSFYGADITTDNRLITPESCFYKRDQEADQMKAHIKKSNRRCSQINKKRKLKIPN